MNQCDICSNQDGAECVGCQGWKRSIDSPPRVYRSYSTTLRRAQKDEVTAEKYDLPDGGPYGRSSEHG